MQLQIKDVIDENKPEEEINLILDNLKYINEKINEACYKSGRKSEDIELVGVTKTVDAQRIMKAIDAGITHVGENRVQEYLEKYDMFCEKNVKTSIIGHLQTNKVKYIIDKVDLIQSVDSIKLAREIDRQAEKCNKIMDILLEVNIAEENSKFGVSSEQITELVYEIAELKNICVKGLMSIPPVFTDEITQRKYFQKLYKIFIDIGNKKLDNIYMDTLSMGMSGDFYYAILEGSNMIRVGTKLFGNRNYM